MGSFLRRVVICIFFKFVFVLNEMRLKWSCMIFEVGLIRVFKLVFYRIYISIYIVKLGLGFTKFKFNRVDVYGYFDNEFKLV